MAELNVQQKNLANELRKAYPELKSYSDEQILTIYNEQIANLQLSEDEHVSIMSGIKGKSNQNQGLQLERTTSAEVTKEQESQLLSALTKRINDVSTNVDKAEDSNGFLGKAWSWSKNNIPFLNKITDSSNEVREQQKAELEALKKGNIKEVFKEVTGLDYTAENVNKFLNNEVQTKSEQALNGYKEGQDMALDVSADMISGILAVGALALAPVTGGASILVAAGVGAATKVTIKALASGEYSTKDLIYDSITGGINGAFAPITNGLGGAAGTGVAKLFGLEALESTAKTALSQAAKQAGKEVVEEVAEQTVKQTGKNLLTRILAKQGSEYVLKQGAEKTLKTTIGKVVAYGTDMAVDGALSGAVDGLARPLAEGRFEDIPQEMLSGFVGGAIASPFIGGGFRLVGNASSTVLNKINNKITFSSILPNGISTKFAQGQVGDCPLLSMIDGFLANDRTKGLLTNAIQTDVNGNFAVKIGDKTVTVLRSSLSDEMLADQSGIRIFEQAYKQVVGDLDGGFADVVAKHFGLNPLHITSDNITDKVLEKIANDSDNYVLSLGLKLNSEGVVTPDGEFQHYFSIKNVDTKTKTVTLVDTYDTSKTLTMSFDNIKTQGVSIDGGSIGKTDLPNTVRNADDVKFRGQEVTQKVDGENSKVVDETTVKTESETRLYDKLANAKSREDFIAIRDEIKAMPQGAERTALQEEYLRKYNEWSSNPARPDIRMEYKPENTAIKELTDAEFDQLRSEIEPKLKECGIEIKSNHYNKYNVQIANKILSEEQLYSNKNFMEFAYDFIQYTKTQNQAQLANKILSEEQLYSNKNFVEVACDMIYWIKTQEQAQIANKILSEEQLYSNKNLMELASDIIGFIRTSEQVQIVNKIFENKDLYRNEKYIKSVRDIIYYIRTPEKYKIAIKLMENKELFENKIFMSKAINILLSADTPEVAQIKCDLIDKICAHKKLYENEKFMENVADIVYHTNTPEVAQIKCDLIDKICAQKELYENEKFMKIAMDIITLSDNDNIRYIQENIINNYNIIKQKIEIQKEKVLANPELYINGECANKAKAKELVEEFFEKNTTSLLLVASVMDNESFNVLLRNRLDDATVYLFSVREFNSEQLNLLKDLCSSVNTEFQAFKPSLKVEFIDLIYAYKENNLSLDKIQKMIKNKKIDLEELQFDLFNKILKNSGLSDAEIASIPNDKLRSWDLNYIHLLSKEIQTGSDAAFFDIFRAGNLEDFNKYIHNIENVYGQSNAKTKELFTQMDMDYDKWVKPSKDAEIHFVAKDSNAEQLNQIVAQITEDMNILMQTPVKGFLKKQFPKFIKGEEFVIPNEYITSKAKLTELVKILTDTSEQGQLAQVWKRAQGNSTNPDSNRAQVARRTLTILGHLNQRLTDISAVKDAKVSKDLDLTIKMWDRIPQKDIFQGNYSTCCIGMGNGHGSAMPHYIMNTSYNMIELVDNKTGKTIGNALCYFIKGKDGKPAFIIDNIEINNSTKPSNEVGVQLRNSMVEYASRISKEVTGLEDTPIYMSSHYNDVPISDLKSQNENIEFLGDVDCDEIYMDLYDGPVEKRRLKSNKPLLKLR